MSGPLWIVSYLALASFVVFLGLAVVALYRLVGSLGAAATSEIAWPFRDLRPGDPIPPWIPVPVSTRAAFLALVAADDNSLATAASVALVGRETDTPWFVFAVRDEDKQWIRSMSSELAAHTYTADPENLASLGLGATPVVALVREGHVVDAVAGVQGPAQVTRLLERFPGTYEEAEAIRQLSTLRR